MHPPILRCLVAGAVPAVRPFSKPGQMPPLPPLLAIETLTTYLRSVDPRTENSRTWNDFVVDHQIRDRALLRRCNAALRSARNAANERKCRPSHCDDHEVSLSPSRQQQAAAAWQLRLAFDS
ncbi:MAG TPA: hypothetical protein VMM36_10175 [Opitutaceae bacterium]|nr:hypothetical protein [Opitutaceae bacterium]